MDELSAEDIANIRNGNIEEYNLQGADLQGADLQEAYLLGADLQGTDLQEAQLQGANLGESDLQGANLQGANLQGADLRWADLRRADLRRANLQGADLRYTNMKYALLSGCIFTGAKIYEANMYNADWGEDDENVSLLNAIHNEIVPEDDMLFDAPMQGVAFEVHNAFDKLNMNMDKYMDILNSVINDDHILYYKRNIIDYVRQQFTEKINELSFLNKEVKIQELNTVLTKLGLSDMINDEQVQLKIGKTVDYVLKQSPAFIELYISGFIEECAHAYEGEGSAGVSCVKGIVERFVLFIGSTLQELCNSDENENENDRANTGEREGKRRKIEREEKIAQCTPDQLALLKLFTKINIDTLIQQWNQKWSERSEAWQAMSTESRREDFKQFIKEKYIEADAYTPEIERLIDAKTATYEYVFANREDNEISFGGFKRHIKRKTKRIRLKKKRTRKNIKKKKCDKSKGIGKNKNKSKSKNKNKNRRTCKK